MSLHFELMFPASEIVRDIVGHYLKGEGFQVMLTPSRKADSVEEAKEYTDPGDIRAPTIEGKSLILEVKSRFKEKSHFTTAEDHPYPLVTIDRRQSYEKKRAEEREPHFIITYCPATKGMIWLDRISTREFWVITTRDTPFLDIKDDLYYECWQVHWDNYYPGDKGKGLLAFLKWKGVLTYPKDKTPKIDEDLMDKKREKALRLYEIYKQEMEKKKFGNKVFSS